MCHSIYSGISELGLDLISIFFLSHLYVLFFFLDPSPLKVGKNYSAQTIPYKRYYKIKKEMLRFSTKKSLKCGMHFFPSPLTVKHR